MLQETQNQSNNQTNNGDTENSNKSISLPSGSGSTSGTTTVGTTHLEETILKLQEEIKELKANSIKHLNDNTNKETNILPQNNLGYQEIKLVVKDNCDTVEERLKEEDNIYEFLNHASYDGTINNVIDRFNLNNDLSNFYFLRQMKAKGYLNWDTSKFSYNDQKRAAATAIRSNTWSL